MKALVVPRTSPTIVLLLDDDFVHAYRANRSPVPPDQLRQVRPDEVRR